MLTHTCCAVSLIRTGAQAGEGLAVVDSDTYKTLGIEASADLYLIEFYSDMCGSCKEFKPTFVELADAFPALIGGACNIDTDAGMKLANELGVLNGARVSVQTHHF